MRWHDYELDGEILKVNGDTTLCRSDRVLVDVSKGTLVMTVKEQERKVGHVFTGHGRLLLDAIVETENGAFGKTIDRELKESFLMLGNNEEIGQNLSPANGDDLAEMGVEQNRIVAEAQNLLHMFSKNGKSCGPHCSSEGNGSVFAFINDEGELDSLVINHSKLVYATKDVVFVSSGSKSVLTDAGQVVVSRHGRSLFVSRPHMSHICH